MIKKFKLNDLITNKTFVKLKLLSNVVDAIAPAIKHPTTLNCFSTVIKLVELVAEQSKFMYASDIFDSPEWDEDSIPDALAQLVFELTQNYPSEMIKFTHTTQIAKLIQFDEIKLGCTFSALSTQQNTVSRMYVQTGYQQKLRIKLKQLLWTKFGNSNIVMRKKKIFGPRKEQKIEFAVDNLVDALSSQIATEYASKFSRAFHVHENRSLLLFGPPGSGKSTMARQVASLLDLKCFRLSVDDIADDVEILYDIISLFEPECIILDDFDRIEHDATTLELIAYLRKNIRLVVATANHRNNIDEALLRPERFDELVLIETLDEGVIKHLLGEYTNEAYDLVKDWPIVFIKEYVRRRKWLSSEEAQSSFKELSERVDRLQNYVDTEQVLKISKNVIPKSTVCRVK